MASPNGRILATGTVGRDAGPGEVNLWKLVPGKQVDELEPLPHSWTTPGLIQWIRFSRNGERIVMVSRAAGDGDLSVDAFKNPVGVRRVVVGDIETGREIARFAIPKPTAGGTRRSLAISPSGTRLAVGAMTGTIQIYDLDTSKLWATIQLKDPSSLAFSNDGALLAAGARDDKVRIWDFATQKLLHTCTGHKSWVEALAFSPDGKMLASGGQDNIVHIWDVPSGKPTLDLAGHTFWILDSCLSKDGRRAVTTAGDGSARVWDAETGAPIRVHRAKRGQWIPAVAMAPDGEQFALSEENRVAVYNLESGKLVWEYAPPDLKKTMFTTADYSNDGQRLAAAGSDGIVRVWAVGGDAAPMEIRHARKVDKANLNDRNYKLRVTTACLSPDGSQLALATQSAMAASSVIEIWSVGENAMIRAITLPKGNCEHLTYSSDGKQLLSAGSSTARGTVDMNRDISSPNLADSVSLWEVASGAQLRQYGLAADHGQSRRTVKRAIFLGDGKRIVTGEHDGTVRIYDTESGNRLAEFKAHTSVIHTMASDAAGQRLLTGGEGLVGLVWDLEAILRE